MKRFSVALMLVILALALVPGAALAHTCNAPAQYPLYAGQTTLVGYVTVCNDGNNLTVTYDTSSTGWPISETHLAVGDALSDIPQRNGNPPPGQFPYSGNYNPAVTTVTYTIPKSAIGPIGVGSTVYIAAHGVVWNVGSTGPTGSMQVCSNGDETYTAYNNAVLGPDAGAPQPRTGIAYPSAEAYGEQNDTAASLWDLGVGAPFYTTSGSTGCADWIWERNLLPTPEGVVLNQVVNSINGDRVEFTENFSIPGPFASGTLYASCDNAYEAYVNTTTPGSPLISGQTGATPTYPDWWTSDLRQSSVDTSNWQSVESAPLTGLLQGSNYLFFRAANEYMNSDDPLNGDPGNTPVSAISSVPPEFKFVPSAYINPAGLIFQADINYYNDDETAWGAQGPGPGANQFPGKNWATYIKYTWQ
jgi:hypothetical protein